ncbi:histidine phosphatase family protein [Dactylosporangium sp. NPDC050688]|uniref:histidine phosphatase family protein n=1 Tax=Dactylosporangium sp. NPDC050688 TaxID=3157217 RepID=UPI0033DF626E
MLARTTLYLVRHGHADGHTPGSSLSAAGRAQAERLGHRLRGVPFTSVHHSPLRRAAETAAIVAAHLPGAPAHACDLVTDRTPVPSPGRETDYPERYRPWLDQVPPAERDPDATALQAAVARLLTVGDDDRTELLVTHNFVIGWFVRHVLDAPTWRWLGLNQDNCALTVLAWETDRPPALVAFNDTGHLHHAG